MDEKNPRSTQPETATDSHIAEASPRSGEASGVNTVARSRPWLTGLFYFMLLWLFGLVVMGGTVRLTGSGMSIPDWPIIYYGPDSTQGSILPPFNEAAWETVHETYHVEYLTPIGRTVSMERFKTEFWIEYGHRALAKVFGFFWLAALIWICRVPSIRRDVLWLFIAASLVLVAQATLGGTVVLRHTPSLLVSFHLTTAFIFVALVVWITLKLMRRPEDPVAERAPALTSLAWVTAGVCLIQVFLGGIMAKTNAARIEVLGTWPKMGETLIPPRDALFDPTLGVLMNFLENQWMIQFVHRWFAFAVVAAVIILAVKCMKQPLSPMGRWTMRFAVFVVTLQVLLGIFTLIYLVPYFLAILHLTTGLVVFLALIVMVYEIRHNAAILALEEREAARLENAVEATA